MRRPILTLFLLLLLSTLLTFTIQCVAVIRPTRGVFNAVQRTVDPSIVWPRPMPPEYAPHPIDRQTVRAWGSTSQFWGGPWQGPNPGGSTRGFLVVTSGWPMRSAVARTYLRDPQTEYRSSSLITRTSNWPAWLKKGVPTLIVVPVRPMLPGFLVNTALYSASLALVTLVPAHVRRASRRRRRRCVKCGYELAATGAKCPECGTQTNT